MARSYIPRHTPHGRIGGPLGGDTSGPFIYIVMGLGLAVIGLAGYGIYKLIKARG